MTKLFVAPTSTVYPSALAEATAPVPMLPPAPGRLSTSTGWPSFGRSSSARSRLTTSPMAPAT
jgi:hypothetical protein